jgi:hypothetical protein
VRCRTPGETDPVRCVRNDFNNHFVILGLQAVAHVCVGAWRDVRWAGEKLAQGVLGC